MNVAAVVPLTIIHGGQLAKLCMPGGLVLKDKYFLTSSSVESLLLSRQNNDCTELDLTIVTLGPSVSATIANRGNISSVHWD